MKKKITVTLSTIAIAASVIVFNQGFAAESSGSQVSIVRYETENGIPITISQSENPYGIEEGINLVKSWYDPSVTEETEINGHKAVIENANRKHVHIITEDTLYTVNSVGADNLDQLIEIAKQINIE
jgi:hypothetical protein